MIEALQVQHAMHRQMRKMRLTKPVTLSCKLPTENDFVPYEHGGIVSGLAVVVDRQEQFSRQMVLTLRKELVDLYSRRSNFLKNLEHNFSP